MIGARTDIPERFPPLTCGFHGAPWTGSESFESLDREPFDVLVIGGGITGAGTALDAAFRGLKVALVEKDDFASGTSSRSSKLIHGGLRYLKGLEFGLVREGLRERRELERMAPHLVSPLRFVVPRLPPPAARDARRPVRLRRAGARLPLPQA